MVDSKQNSDTGRLSGVALLLRFAVIVLAVVVGVGASCGDASTGSGDDSYSHIGDAGAVVDTGADGSASVCRTISSMEQCRTRHGCKWLTATCDGGRVVGGCFASSKWTSIPVDCDVETGTADAGGADAGVECAEIDDEATCRAQHEACRWWTPKCGGEVVERRCIDRDYAPDYPDCGDASRTGDGVGETDGGFADTGIRGDGYNDAGSATDAGVASDASSRCTGHATKATCKRDSACKWWVGTCSGHVVRETCIAKGSSPPNLTCKSIRPENCHKASSESSCYPPNCQWVVKGCGGGPANSLSITACLPRTTCKSDIDCPGQHRCAKLYLDPCYRKSCGACGGAERRCVPMRLLKP